MSTSWQDVLPLTVQGDVFEALADADADAVRVSCPACLAPDVWTRHRGTCTPAT